MSLIIFPQFREEQRDSRYPFEDNAGLVDESGVLSMPNEVFIDASIYLIGGGGSAYIASIEIDGRDIHITVQTTDPIVTATGTYKPDESSIVYLKDTYGRSAGVFVMGAQAVNFFFGIPAATYTFKSTALRFVATCFVPTPNKGVRGFRLPNGTIVASDILLLGENGVVFRNVSKTGLENKIRVDVIGEPLFKRKNCDDENLEPAARKFLSTINGCGADEFGNFVLTTASDDPANPTPIRIYPTNSDTLVIDIVSGV